MMLQAANALLLLYLRAKGRAREAGMPWIFIRLRLTCYDEIPYYYH